MKNLNTTLSIASIAYLLMTSTTLAVQAESNIRSVPDEGNVAVSGTVSSIGDQHSFVISDSTGTIEVKLAPNESLVLTPGDNVTVTGAVERPFWGLAGKDIAASNVAVHKDLVAAASSPITRAPDMSISKTQNAQIAQLPSSGLVQVSGTVDNVSDPKKFTVHDATGAIDVAVKSDENVVVTKGAQVTVTGYVDNGTLGKDIDATHVVVASTTPPAELMPSR